jgi:hypothetical protein
MLIVVFLIVMLSAVMLNVVILRVMAPKITSLLGAERKPSKYTLVFTEILKNYLSPLFG